MKLVSVWTYLMGILILMAGAQPSHASMTWTTPYGTVGLPLDATEVLLGYDGILKQAIGGASVPVYTDPKNIIVASVGAVAPWPNTGGGVAVEPLVMVGHDILREIPTLNEFQSLHINIFGRYASTEGGRFGAGVAVSYAFGGGSLISQ
jgi:hypothetical protein